MKTNQKLEGIQMVDLYNQFLEIEDAVMNNIHNVIKNSQFINGPLVLEFQKDLESYLNAKKVIPCANGTDALQIALMSLDLNMGDEVIIPSFTYAATAEVVCMLGLKPVMVDVDDRTFNIDCQKIVDSISEKTKVIIPVHLFGQAADMHPIMEIAKKYNLFVVEDNAQSLGGNYTFPDGRTIKNGLIGDIGCTSFFPSKNLGAFGDGGAIYTNNDSLGSKMQMIANHGQSKKYYHEIIGCNSRLDSIQAAILIPKLKKLDAYNEVRRQVANQYDYGFKNVDQILIPYRHNKSDHVFHQYTIRILDGRREELMMYLKERHIPSMIYYPLPLYKQKAYYQNIIHENTELLCNQVLALPIHTEMKSEQIDHIISSIKNFIN